MRFLACFFLLMSSVALAGPVPRKADDNLTEEFAKMRRSQIKTIHYELVFELDKIKTTYHGKSVILVELARKDLPLTFDFMGDKIESITINDVALKNYPRRLGSFDIPAQALHDFTKIEINYTNSFSKEAAGFQRSVDPEDGSAYVFTDFEPYYAHSLFPCFDQPDIKATFQMIVKAPVDWKVIHNESPSNTVIEGQRAITFFPPTKPLSTYLFFLGAGPFVEWNDNYLSTPLTIHARKTLAQHVDAAAIFETTKKGLKFFNEYFGRAYPFSKYGQIFIPEFAWGGMENPGAVALNEKFIFRGPVPRSKMEDRDNLILHEMAHMWFGDLVTMQWWNDLWLNESFATYTASMAQDRAMESKGTWQDFFSTKTWGYWQDQLVTTHPIETPVLDVRTAKGNFDGITYAKGASALKQLHFFVGEKGFKDGLQSYFNTYAFKNTRREDFINEIARASQMPLGDWTTKWLQTAGMNRVKLAPQCKDGLITSLSIDQKPSVSKALSPHRTRLGLYELKNGALVQFRTHDVIYDQEKIEIKELVGTRCPDFFLPNQDDQDYALFSLDAASLQHARLALTSLPDGLSRLMVWNILGQMVRDEELKPLEFIEIAETALATEKDDLLLGNILGNQSGLRLAYRNYLTKEERALKAPALEAVLWDRVLKANPGSSLQMLFFDFFLSVAQTPEALQKIGAMLKNNTPPEGITLDQDRRWNLLISLSANGYAESSALLVAEKMKDPSTMGKRLAYGVEASLPDMKVKNKFWTDFISNKNLTYSTFSEGARRFHGANRLDLSEAFVDSYFKRIQSMDWEKHDTVIDIYFERLFPSNICSQKLLERSEKELKKAKKLTPLARRSWLEANDELARCVRIRKPLVAVKPNA